MMIQNRSLQSQYGGMMELRDIDSRRESIRREEYSRFGRRWLRHTRLSKDKGQLEKNKEEHESLESYEPPSHGRGNDNLHRDLGATKSHNENEARPKRGQPYSSGGEWSSSGEDDEHAGIEKQEQNLRARANTSTQRLNERLEDIMGQEEVIQAIYRDAYGPTERSQLTAIEPRSSDISPGGPNLDISQAPYVPPPRCGGLSVSTKCCGSIEEDSDQGEEEEELTGHSAPEAGDSNHEELPSQAAGMEPTGVPGANVDGDDGQEPSNHTTTETPAEEILAKSDGGHDDDQ